MRVNLNNLFCIKTIRGHVAENVVRQGTVAVMLGKVVGNVDGKYLVEVLGTTARKKAEVVTGFLASATLTEPAGSVVAKGAILYGIDPNDWTFYEHEEQATSIYDRCRKALVEGGDG